jgi:hypothetical protein
MYQRGEGVNKNTLQAIQVLYAPRLQSKGLENGVLDQDNSDTIRQAVAAVL